MEYKFVEGLIELLIWKIKTKINSFTQIIEYSKGGSTVPVDIP